MQNLDLNYDNDSNSLDLYTLYGVPYIINGYILYFATNLLNLYKINKQVNKSKSVIIKMNKIE